MNKVLGKKPTNYKKLVKHSGTTIVIRARAGLGSGVATFLVLRREAVFVAFLADWAFAACSRLQDKPHL